MEQGKVVESLTEELLLVYDHLNVIYDIGRQLEKIDEQQDVEGYVLDLIKEVLDLDTCWIIRNGDKGEPEYKRILGENQEMVNDLREYVSKHIRYSERVIINACKPYELHMIGVSIGGAEQALGQVGFCRGGNKPGFTTNEGKLCSFIVGYMTNAFYRKPIKKVVESGNKEKRIDSMQVKAFLSALGIIDKGLVEHGRRVAAHAKAILKAAKSVMEISKDIEESIETAALLHDIGQIGIDYQILVKSFRTEVENQYYQTHCEKGAEILKHFENDILIRAVLEHHERYDGLGYPKGLRGDEISITGQIIGIADAYDSLIHNVQYSKSVSKDKAFEEIVSGSGKKYNPLMVTAFMKSLKNT